MDDECIHGLGPVAACVICNGREAAAKAADVAAWVKGVARRDSQCAGCDLPIVPGQPITWKERVAARHETCR